MLGKICSDGSHNFWIFTPSFSLFRIRAREVECCSCPIFLSFRFCFTEEDKRNTKYGFWAAKEALRTGQIQNPLGLGVKTWTTMEATKKWVVNWRWGNGWMIEWVRRKEGETDRDRPTEHNAQASVQNCKGEECWLKLLGLWCPYISQESSSGSPFQN